MMKYLKVRSVKDPCRANDTDSGIDFFVPDNLEFVKITPQIPYDGAGAVIGNKIEILPGCWALIPSGIKMVIEPWYDLVFNNKSWVAVKQGLIVGATVVDSSYRGEAHLHLINTSNVTQYVELGQKITQGIIRKVELCVPMRITNGEFLEHSDTERGTGGFGSTWTK